MENTNNQHKEEAEGVDRQLEVSKQARKPKRGLNARAEPFFPILGKKWRPSESPPAHKILPVQTPRQKVPSSNPPLAPSSSPPRQPPPPHPPIVPPAASRPSRPRSFTFTPEEIERMRLGAMAVANGQQMTLVPPPREEEDRQKAPAVGKKMKKREEEGGGKTSETPYLDVEIPNAEIGPRDPNGEMGPLDMYAWAEQMMADPTYQNQTDYFFSAREPEP